MRNLVRAVASITVAALAIAGGTANAEQRAERRPTRVSQRAAEAAEARMVRAKDLMSDDQWVEAIAVLKACLSDPREQNKDEALFWLAHSQNRTGGFTEAVESIRRLQREYPRSRWSAPAHSLIIELAQKLGRHDVLWWTATTPPHPPAPPVAATPPPPRGRVVVPMPPAPPAPPAPASQPAPSAPPAPAAPPPPPPGWLPEAYMPDTDLRVEALGSLIRTDAHKVIPMLREIVFESDNPGVARRALFVLAQSRNPMATATVVEVARSGPQPVRLAAVRDLGFFGGPEISKELLQVYWTADQRIKQQVVISLGDRADASALVTIAEKERDRGVRESAIFALGRVGGREPLRDLYWKVAGPLRHSIIIGLSSARDDEGLIRIASEEKDTQLRTEALNRLRLLGTPKAKAYLTTIKK